MIQEFLLKKLLAILQGQGVDSPYDALSWQPAAKSKSKSPELTLWKAKRLGPYSKATYMESFGQSEFIKGSRTDVTFEKITRLLNTTANLPAFTLSLKEPQ